MTDNTLKRTRLVVVAFALLLMSGVGVAQTRDTLDVGVVDLPPALDPHSQASITGIRIYPNVFETLIYMDPLDHSQLSPGLAESWERLSDTQLELKLRTDVSFHNGDPLTSKDVKFSLDRILFDDEPSLSTARALLSVIEEVETPDDFTVIITTKQPDAILEFRLATQWGAWILPADYFEEVGMEQYGRAPIATGPFKVTQFAPDIIALEAFDDYWDETPNVREVNYRVIPESSGRLTSLVNNEVEMISPVLPEQLAILETYDEIEVQCTPEELIHLLTFRDTSPGMEDKRLRQAINLAIDREGIVEALWGGTAEVTHGHQFSDYGDMFLEDVPLTEYDPERARQLVEESDYNGEVIYYDLIPNYYDNDIQAAEIIVEMLSEVGIDARIRPTTAFWANDDRGIHPWSYAMRFPDPVGGLWLLFGEDSSRQAGQGDWTDVPTEFNELGHQLAATLETEERREIWHEMHDIWLDEAPGTALWQVPICVGLSKSIDWEVYPSNTLDFSARNLSFRDE